MSKSLMGGVMSFAFLLVGFVTIAYAGSFAYENADAESDVVETLHPLAELLLSFGGLTVLIIVAISIIGAVAWMLSSVNRSGTSTFGGRR